MAQVDQSTREEHLLALRSAIPVLLLGAIVLGLSVVISGNATGPICVGLGTIVVFGAVYVVRTAYPNREIWIEPGQACVRPLYALRAAISACLGVLVFQALMGTGTYFDPYYPRSKFEVLTMILVAGTVSALAVGLLVYAFSAVLFLSIRTIGESSSTDIRRSALMLALSLWIPNLIQYTEKHPFLIAVGMASWRTATVVLSLGLGWSLYAKFIPDSRSKTEATG